MGVPAGPYNPNRNDCRGRPRFRIIPAATKQSAAAAVLESERRAAVGSSEISALMRAVESLEGADDIFPLRLSATGWAQLANVMERQNLEPGALLLRRGDAGHRAYLVESGQLQVFVTGGAPRCHRVATLGSGTMVGEPALFASTPCMAHVEAATACVVWSLCADRLLALAPVAPALVLEVLRAAGVLMTARRRANLERGIPVT